LAVNRYLAISPRTIIPFMHTSLPEIILQQEAPVACSSELNETKRKACWG